MYIMHIQTHLLTLYSNTHIYPYFSVKANNAATRVIYNRSTNRQLYKHTQLVYGSSILSMLFLGSLSYINSSLMCWALKLFTGTLNSHDLPRNVQIMNFFQEIINRWYRSNSIISLPLSHTHIIYNYIYTHIYWICILYSASLPQLYRGVWAGKVEFIIHHTQYNIVIQIT